MGHDVQICDFVTVYPSVNISGNVIVEKCVELGTGTQIIQGKRIGQETIVGAGAVIIQDLPSGCTAVGSPAKPIKFMNKGERAVGATGCRMFLDLYKQVSGTAGDYQVYKSDGSIPQNGMMLNIGRTATTNYVYVVGK